MGKFGIVLSVAALTVAGLTTSQAASDVPLVQGLPSLSRDLVLCRDADQAASLAQAMRDGTDIDNPVARGAVWQAVVQGECAGFETLLGFTPVRAIAEANGLFVIEAEFSMADGPATFFMVTRRPFHEALSTPLPDLPGAAPQAATLPLESNPTQAP